ncbi:MAG: hypothetical protein ACPGXK_08125 [Phycisphaerae bacterium]
MSVVSSLCLLTAVPSAWAGLTVFENDLSGWQAAAGTTVTLDFDSVPGSTFIPLDGDEFSGSSGFPVFTSVDGSGLYAQANLQFPNPPSPPNMFAPECDPSCEGVIRVSFAQPLTAIGAVFVDVEGDFESTGLSLTLDAALPDIPFSSDQGQGSFSFLGITSDTPFFEVDIHFATAPGSDGVLIDDLSYSLPPPIPTTSEWGLVVMFIGMLTTGSMIMVRFDNRAWLA